MTTVVRTGYTQTGAQYSLSTPLGADAFLVNSFSGEEALSAPYRITVDLRSSTTTVDPTAMIGASVGLTVQSTASTTRYFHGIVTRFTQSGGGPAYAVYEAEIGPSCLVMGLATDRRIFQNLAVPDIVTTLLGEFGVSYSSKLQGSYTARDYCVQFDETSLQFIERIMAEEGIFYFFEHTASSHTMVLGDASSVHTACPTVSTVNYYSEQGRYIAVDTVYQFELEHRLVPDSLSLSDFDFTQPSTSLLTTTGSTSGKGAQFRFPGGYTTTSDGSRLAKIGLQALQQPGQTTKGEGYCYCFTAGYTFTVAGHYRSDANASYVLSHVSHRGDIDGYSNHFTAYPSTLTYRPSLRSKPRIHGSQTAMVVGKSGEEIWTDQYGRVKLHFPWDRKGKSDETSSCWVRVSQGWAGLSWGTVFIPRIGMEVIVSFIEGDADRPMVTGCVYNAEQTVPYSLPGNQTRSTVKTNSSKGGGGGNEICLEDKAGSENFYVFAQKDMNVTVTNDRNTTITNGNESLTVSTGNRTVAVSKGNETYSVKGTRGVTVEGNETHTNKADFEQDVSGKYTLKVTGDLLIDVTGSVTIKSGSSVTVKSSTSLEQDSGTSMTVKSGTDMTIQSGTSLAAKAGTTGDIEASASLNVKASAMATVDGGGMLTLKGGMVKIN